MQTFSTEQIEAIRLLYESAKTFIPVVTGFLVVFSGSLGYIWRDERKILSASLAKHAGLTIALGILSLGVWSGTIPFCIRSLKYIDFNLFEYGQYCAQGGHLLFFFSVWAGVSFYWRVFLINVRTAE
jgi:hypothetical protein